MVVHAKLLQYACQLLLGSAQLLTALFSQVYGLSVQVMFVLQRSYLAPDLLDQLFVATQINGAHALAEAKAQSKIAGAFSTAMVLLDISLVTQSR